MEKTSKIVNIVLAVLVALLIGVTVLITNNLNSTKNKIEAETQEQTVINNLVGQNYYYYGYDTEGFSELQSIRFSGSDLENLTVEFGTGSEDGYIKDIEVKTTKEDNLIHLEFTVKESAEEEGQLIKLVYDIEANEMFCENVTEETNREFGNIDSFEEFNKKSQIA